MAQPSQWPDVYDVSIGDLIEVMAAGIRDFRAAPQYGLVIGGTYAVVGWVVIALVLEFDLPFLAYPLAMGFALIAPFAGVGFYAVSDLLEKGEPLSWSALREAIRGSTQRDLRWMALITAFAFFIWVDIAAMLFIGFMGFSAFHDNFLELLFTTSTGVVFLVVGHIVGAIIALLVFSISVVSFPMLYDRDIDFVTAMVTSVRLVIANPKSMVIWCIVIGILTGLSLLSAFLGLFVMLPVVGHASWHLYRRAVAPMEVGQALVAE